MRRNNSYGAFGLVLSHGMAMAITLYLAYRAGDWLDKHFGTTPWLMIVAVLLMVAANLHLMVKDILQETSRDTDRSKNDSREKEK